MRTSRSPRLDNITHAWPLRGGLSLGDWRLGLSPWEDLTAPCGPPSIPASTARRRRPSLPA
jgi:hypothetical protein